MNKTNIFTRLISKIKSCRIFSKYNPRNEDQQQLDDILLRFIFDNLPRGIDSSLAFLKVDFGMDQLAAYICQKIYAQSVNYPGSGLEAAFTNQTLIDIILNKNTVIFPNHNMVKKCVNTLSTHANPFECTLDTIQLSGLRHALNRENLFVSATCDVEGGESPFPCYFVGNYLYSIGPMIIDPDGSHIGRTLIMIHVLNYKNHIYPCGIYFWVYPSSSEGGLNRIFFKLPGGVTGATYIKGTEYFSQSEIAALESIINDFGEAAQANPAGPTLISDYDTFICFLGNMPYLQKKDISSMLPTISSGVQNRYCYKINMATPIGIDLFTCDNPSLPPEVQQQEKRNNSILFFRHIFDYGFDNNYRRDGRSFKPIRPINFDTVCASLRAKIGDVDVKFPWIHTLEQYKLQPVCSFSCIHNYNGIVRFEELLTKWQGTETLQGVQIYHHPHPNVCTITGSLAYVVGHRGNSFLTNMVPAPANSIVQSFLPRLPVDRLSTYSRHEKMLFMAPSETRRGRQFTELNHPIMDRQVLQGDHGLILTTRIRSIVKKIASFFRMPQVEKAKLDKKIRDKLKICLFAFLEIPMSEESNQEFITQTEKFLMEKVEKGFGLQNISSILDAATYASMIAADMKRVYLGIDPIKDAAPPKKILVQVSWLGKNHNYVPIGTTSFDYDDDNSAARISSIFTDPNFSPYIMQARRDAMTFTENDLHTMTLNKGAAARSIYSHDIRMRKLPVKVFNKTMLFRVIVYNDVDNNPESDGPESVKFGALEVIVSMSSTAVLTKKIKELKFGTDIQFCVVSITACHHIRGPDGVDYFQKFQTFHGTNADVEAIGIWGTIKPGEYAATIIGNDQFHPELSEALRKLIIMDDNYVNTSVSPYNTTDHWIMKLFAPVLRRGDDEQTLRNEIFKKWEWENTIANFYGIPLTTPIVSEMTTQIQQMGNVIRWAAYIFFSEHEINPEQADEYTSDAERSSRSSSKSSKSSKSSRSSISSKSSSSRSSSNRSSSNRSSNRSSSSKESTGKRLRRFLLLDPLAPQAPPGETPKSYKSRKQIVNSSDEGSSDEEGIKLNWGDLDTPKSKNNRNSNSSTGTASPTGIGGTRRCHVRDKLYHSLATRKRKYVRSKYSLKNKKNINKNVNKHNKNKNIKTKTKTKRVKSYQLRPR
jgi:hypothetical protein